GRFHDTEHDQTAYDTNANHMRLTEVKSAPRARTASAGSRHVRDIEQLRGAARRCGVGHGSSRDLDMLASLEPRSAKLHCIPRILVDDRINVTAFLNASGKGCPGIGLRRYRNCCQQ